MTSRRGPAVAVAVAVALALLGAAGCAGDEGGGDQATPTPTSSQTAALRLPPANVASLAAVVDPLVAPLGLRLTRGSTIDRNTGRMGFTARHLAIYVEPTSTWTDTRFVETIVPLSRVLTPQVFALWPDLESYDVCQEPSPGVDDRPEPPVQSQFEATKAYATSTDWNAVDLPTLIKSPAGATLVVANALTQNPVFQAALRTATSRP